MTDPSKPRALKQNYLPFGVHNTFIWQQGSNAYMMVVDDNNIQDTHIVDITKPQSPREDGNTYILGSDRNTGLWIFANP